MTTELIRNIIVFLHATAGTIAMLTAIAALCLKKGSIKHIISGRIYFWTVIAVMLTALASNIITVSFPFYLIGFMAFYLAWFGSIRPSKLRLWEYFLIIKGGFTTLLFLVVGISALFNNNIQALAYNLFGFVFFLFIMDDIKTYFSSGQFGFRKQQKNNTGHINRMIFSFYLITVGFTISQFSWVEGNKHILLWTVPLVILAPVFLNFNFRYKKSLTFSN